MDQTVMERLTVGQTNLVVTTSPQYRTYKNLAWILDTTLSDQQIAKLVKKSREILPMPIVLARFKLENFSNERLQSLYDVGVDGCLIGEPADTLIEQTCARLGKYILVDSKFGQLRLQGMYLYLGEKRVKLTEKITLILTELLEARGATVSKERLYFVYYGKAIGLNTHTLETQMYRLRTYLNTLGIKALLPEGSVYGYRLELN
jgi:Transcriptional regulatory protein, C terminal